MELKDRVRLILDERHMRQKDLAEAIKVTESYISNLVGGKRDNISETLALLIEQTLGYSARWVLTGEGEPYVPEAGSPELSPAKRRLIAEIEKMSESELDAVQVFIDSLDRYRRAFRGGDGV
ncbi:MAG: helix-turn-helix transcriptional regulator [Oscillibacter sp.]|nr:helix-turn-helix transcriptional regulator [Oscillibacter sp.]